MIVMHKEYGRCSVELGKYVNDQKAIKLLGVEGKYQGQVIAIPTVSIDVTINDDQVIIKGYSEDEGMYEWLRDEGVISESEREVRVGYGKGYVCTLLV